MTIKFIVTRAGRVIFGNRFYKDDLHRNIAASNGISKYEVVGGGVADTDTRKIWGKSYDFGPYDPKHLANTLPGWDISAPGDY